jgi:hypothetical protein
MVAPSRGRGSKPRLPHVAQEAPKVAPSRGRGSKPYVTPPDGKLETSPLSRGRGSKRRQRDAADRGGAVAPSRGRGSKHLPFRQVVLDLESPPSGGVDRNHGSVWISYVAQRRLLRGGVDRNCIPRNMGALLAMLLKVASFTGAWIETAAELGASDGYRVAAFTWAWIETSYSSSSASARASRLPDGGVDRNSAGVFQFPKAR